jgi:hypothetical protein
LIDSVKENKFTWFFNVNIALLFITGCWMVGSLMITAWRDTSDLYALLSALLFTCIIFANISFLISMIGSIVGIVQLWNEEKARSLSAYLMIFGLIFLALTLLLFGIILVFAPSRFPVGGVD